MAAYYDKQPKFDTLGPSRLQPSRWYALRKPLANGMRPPTLTQQDMLGVYISTPIRALSGTVEPPSQRCAKPRLHWSKHGYIFDHPKSIHPVTSSPQSVHTRAELLPATETHSFHHYHVGRELAPNSSCTVRHSRNPATPLKPGIRCGSPPPTPAELHPSDPQTPRVYPI